LEELGGTSLLPNLWLTCWFQYWSIEKHRCLHGWPFLKSNWIVPTLPSNIRCYILPVFSPEDWIRK
jgi:hypothetical protein